MNCLTFLINIVALFFVTISATWNSKFILHLDWRSATYPLAGGREKRTFPKRESECNRPPRNLNVTCQFRYLPRDTLHDRTTKIIIMYEKYTNKIWGKNQNSKNNFKANHKTDKRFEMINAINLMPFIKSPDVKSLKKKI